VKPADGTTVSMPATEENQAEYPQQKGQKEGLGFKRYLTMTREEARETLASGIDPYRKTK
jgi:hypothetical protein